MRRPDKGSLWPGFRVMTGVLAVGILIAPVVHRYVSEYRGGEFAAPVETAEAADAQSPDAAGVQAADTQAPDTTGAQTADTQASDTAGVLTADTQAPDAAGVQTADTQAPDTTDTQSANVQTPDDSSTQAANSAGIEPPNQANEERFVPDNAAAGSATPETPQTETDTNTAAGSATPETPQTETGTNAAADSVTPETPQTETDTNTATGSADEAAEEKPQTGGFFGDSSLDDYIRRASTLLRQRTTTRSDTAAVPLRLIYPLDPEDEIPEESSSGSPSSGTASSDPSDSGPSPSDSDASGGASSGNSSSGGASSGDSSSGGTSSGGTSSGTTDPSRPGPFPDVSGSDEAADAIRFVSSLGLLGEWKNGWFRPDALLTRGQAAGLLRRLDRALADSEAFLDRRTESGQGPGSGPDASSASDEEWAVSMGILDSGADHNLSTLVTRGQLATFLYRYAQRVGWKTSCTGNLSSYPDCDAVRNYARMPLSWAMEHGIYSVIMEDSLLSDLAVSRRQAALIVTACLADATGNPSAVEISAAAQKPVLSSQSRAKHEALQTKVLEVARKYGATGIQVAVIEQGHVTDAFADGWAVRDAKAMSASTKLRVASLSKVVLAMAAMALREDGTVDLDKPISAYWNTRIVNPYAPNTPITLRNILTHTSSISSVSASLNASAVMRRLGSSSGYKKTVPGSLDGWEYNNYAFGVLGMTLERSNWQTIDQTLWEQFYRAMDIDAAFYAGDLSDSSNLASLYYHTGSVARSAVKQRQEHTEAPGTSGQAFAGGLVISARDLAKMTALLACDGVFEGLRLLDASSVEMMEAHSSRTVDTGFWQGLAIRIRSNVYGRNQICYHTGSAYGVYTGLSYDPETGDGVVVLTTGASGAKDQSGNYAVVGEIYRAVYQAIAR